MVRRILILFAATILLAACETAPRTVGQATSSAATSSAASGANALARELARVGTTVLFGFDSAQLSSEAQRILDRQVAFLQANPSTRIVIGGHADERGTREYNLALGERRASSVRDYLVAKGINAARLHIISYGKERPKAVGSNEEAWRQNRRAESALN